MRCKECGKNLSESCFYFYFVNGNKKQYHVCKKCITLKSKTRWERIKEEKKLQQAEASQNVKKQITPEWVIRNLKRFGNCYVRKISKVNIPEAESLVGCKLKVRLSLKENDGYVIEVQK